MCNLIHISRKFKWFLLQSRKNANTISVVRLNYQIERVKL
jgi:hypothetical protein